jgi:hypothetical protein
MIHCVKVILSLASARLAAFFILTHKLTTMGAEVRKPFFLTA